MSLTATRLYYVYDTIRALAVCIESREITIGLLLVILAARQPCDCGLDDIGMPA